MPELVTRHYTHPSDLALPDDQLLESDRWKPQKPSQRSQNTPKIGLPSELYRQLLSDLPIWVLYRREPHEAYPQSQSAAKCGITLSLYLFKKNLHLMKVLCLRLTLLKVVTP